MEGNLYKGRVFLYTISGCRHCLQAKKSIQELQIPFVEVDIEEYPQCKQEMISRTERKTVPQIFFNNIHVGGMDQLQELISEDEERLQELVKLVMENPVPEDAPQLPDPETCMKRKDTGEFTCEVDEYAELVKELEESGLLSTHWQGISCYNKSFNGRKFVDWLTKKKGIDRENAELIGQELVKRHFVHHVKNDGVFVDGDAYYQLLKNSIGSALNATPISECKQANVKELGEILRHQILKIYNNFISADGKVVNYEGIGKSEEFKHYERLTLELQRVYLDEETTEEKLAFFINIYNCLVIHASIKKGPPNGMLQRYKFFNNNCYVIGGYIYSLQDIENGILRGNKKGIGDIFLPFSVNDPRLKIALKKAEPFIHFALNCGARGCPPIKTYSSQNIYNELQMAAEAFLEDDLNLDIDEENKVVKLSQIFKWYADDFGQSSTELLTWIHNAMGSSDKQQKLKKVMDGEKITITHLPYNWNLNS